MTSNCYANSYSRIPTPRGNDMTDLAPDLDGYDYERSALIARPTGQRVYILITSYANSAPDLEVFSELPTMDFTIFAPIHEAELEVLRYDLSEAHIDGGDSRDIYIADCYICNERHACTSVRVTNPADPTEAYTLTCGHEVI